MATLKESIQKASQDPNSTFAIELRKRIESGQYNKLAQSEGIDLSSMVKQTTQIREPSIIEKIGETAGNIGAGIVKGGLSTLQGISTIGQKGMQTIGLQKEPIAELPKSLTQAEGTAQQVGKGLEQISEFLIPVGNIAKTTSIAGKFAKSGTLLGKALELGTKSLGESTEFASKTALQTGGNLEETKKAGIIGAITPPAIKTIGAGLNKIAPAVSGLISQMIGKSPEHIERAFKNPVAVSEAMSKKIVPLDVREKAISALTDWKQSFGNAYGKTLEEIKSLYPFGKTGKILVSREVNDITKGLPNFLRESRIAVVENGQKLNFDKLNSKIVNSGERNNLQMMYETIKNQKDYSVQGVEDILERLYALRDYTSGDRTISSLVAGKLYNTFQKAAEKAYPELIANRNTYKANIEIWQGIDDILKSVKNEKANPIAVTNVAKRLSNLFAEDNEAYVRALQRLEQVSGQDLLNELAATEFKNIVPGKIGSTLFQASAFAGGVFFNPLLLATLPLFSPIIQGKIITTTGKLAPKLPKITETAIKALTPELRK